MITFESDPFTYRYTDFSFISVPKINNVTVLAVSGAALSGTIKSTATLLTCPGYIHVLKYKRNENRHGANNWDGIKVIQQPSISFVHLYSNDIHLSYCIFSLTSKSLFEMHKKMYTIFRSCFYVVNII